MALELTTLMSTTLRSFINYALAAVSVMIVYYAVKFFLVEPKRKEPNLEDRRAALKKGIDWVKGLSPKEKKAVKEEERQQRKEEERQERQQEKERERVVQGEKKSKKITSNLLKVIACINKAIQNLNDPEETRKWIHRAKRHMVRARDVDILERITQGTPQHGEARRIRSTIVQMREALDSLPLQEAALKRFNQNLGAILNYIGRLIHDLYEQVETQQQAAQQAQQTAQRGRATGARPVAQVRRRLRTR